MTSTQPTLSYQTLNAGLGDERQGLGGNTVRPVLVEVVRRENGVVTSRTVRESGKLALVLGPAA